MSHNAGTTWGLRSLIPALEDRGRPPSSRVAGLNSKFPAIQNYTEPLTNQPKIQKKTGEMAVKNV